MKKNSKAQGVCTGALVAAAYVVLTLLSNVFGLAAGPLQIRLSEALCVLPMLMPSSIGGLYIGCLVANLLTGAVWLDVLLGPLATLVGALGAYALRRYKYIAPLPTVLSNVLIIPPVLAYSYGAMESWAVFALGIAIGELVSAYLLGLLLYGALRRYPIFPR